MAKYLKYALPFQKSEKKNKNKKKKKKKNIYFKTETHFKHLLLFIHNELAQRVWSITKYGDTFH